jgi:hypothetical protein
LEVTHNEHRYWISQAQVTTSSNFEYKVGDCLFDAIAYLLNYSTSLKLIQKNSMCYLQECLTIGTPQTLECCQCELNP